jgi:hypothetical protein
VDTGPGGERPDRPPVAACDYRVAIVGAPRASLSSARRDKRIAGIPWLLSAIGEIGSAQPA